MPGKVRVIPANTNEPMKHVVIYARVSSNTMDQLESLKAQVSGLTKFISGHNNWKLVDIHIDIASAKKDSSRPAFHQMIEECKAGLTDIVVVKSISRLGRDTVEVLDAINTLRESQVRIIFKQEELDTLTAGSSLLISTVEACTQAENETRSANIKWGIKQRASNGSLGFYRRRCYGYDKDKNGDLVINKEQAEVSHKKPDGHINVKVEFGEGEGNVPLDNMVLEYSFEMNAHNRTLLSQIQRASRSADAMRLYPGAFSETLVQLMKEKKLSNKKLADASLVGERTIQRLRNEEEYPTTIQTVLGLCYGLQLSVPEAEMLGSW